jgi:hypothetical protein
VNTPDHVAIHPSTKRTKAIVMQNIPIVAPLTRRTVSRGHGKM